MWRGWLSGQLYIKHSQLYIYNYNMLLVPEEMCEERQREGASSEVFCKGIENVWALDEHWDRIGWCDGLG